MPYERSRSRRVPKEETEPIIHRGVILLNTRPSEPYQPTFPIESKSEALRFALHYVNQLNLGKAIPNMSGRDIKHGIDPAEGVRMNEEDGTFSMELLLIPALKTGIFTVTSDGFISRRWIEEEDASTA